VKTSDFILRYPTNKIHDGICRMRTFVNQKFEVSIILTELSDNTSTSITNSMELIYKYLIDSGLVTKFDFLFEHYEQHSFSSESFDLVYIENGRASWDSVELDFVMQICESQDNEFNTEIKDNFRLLSEIDTLISKIQSSNINCPQQESFNQSEHEPISNQLSKHAIQEIIDRGAGELEIQALLKQDLSVFGEIYGQPKDEYQCFSEFPVGDGCVDFVVFSGRSRMDIFLIEVKGANFNLVNKSGYKKFSSTMETAMDQIRNRLEYIYKNIEEFKVMAHEIRQSAESGKNIYNCFLGPKPNLNVDLNKNINIYPVVIGGRTINDLNESNKRHQYEQRSSPKVNVESWDSWLKKLIR